MLWQLSTGKTVSITFEQWLELTDIDIQYLVSLNHGNTIHSPFFNSTINSKKKESKDDPKVDSSIDYTEEINEVETNYSTPLLLDEELFIELDPEDIEYD